MKAIIRLFALSLVLGLMTSCATGRTLVGTAPVVEGPHITFDVFYQSLSPYGRWISYDQYGQVWIPNAGRGFSPYATNGHWVYSDYGWTWVSDFSWGWAPFHYGRWLYDDYYGWIWVPGSDWAPAWVAWRNSPDYYGWAPLGPGMSINISIGIPAIRWVFLPRRYFGDRWAYRYYLPRQRNVYIIHNTTVINNVHVYQNNRYYAGPSRTEVVRATHRNIRPVRITEASRPEGSRLSGNQLQLYRPAVQRSSATPSAPSTGRQTAPASRPQRTFGEGQRAESNQPARGNSREVRPQRAPERAPVDRGNRLERSGERSAPARTTQPRNASPRVQPREEARPAPSRQQAAPRVNTQPSRSTRPRREASQSPAPRTASPQVQRSRPAASSSRVTHSATPRRSESRQVSRSSRQVSSRDARVASRPGRR